MVTDYINLINSEDIDEVWKGWQLLRSEVNDKNVILRNAIELESKAMIEDRVDILKHLYDHIDEDIKGVLKSLELSELSNVDIIFDLYKVLSKTPTDSKFRKYKKVLINFLTFYYPNKIFYFYKIIFFESKSDKQDAWEMCELYFNAVFYSTEYQCEYLFLIQLAHNEFVGRLNKEFSNEFFKIISKKYKLPNILVNLLSSRLDITCIKESFIFIKELRSATSQRDFIRFGIKQYCKGLIDSKEYEQMIKQILFYDFES